jgi:hypothetical protein
MRWSAAQLDDIGLFFRNHAVNNAVRQLWAEYTLGEQIPRSAYAGTSRELLP